MRALVPKIAIVIGFAVGAGSLVAQAGAEPRHEIVLGTVKVKTTKADGKPWDLGGGAPDLEVVIKNVSRDTRWVSAKAQDTFSRTFNLIANDVAIGDEIEITVWDKDLSNDDLIGAKTVKITEKHIAAGELKLEFGQVLALELKFEAKK